ncbi:uncharacterized protein [Haliotis cracherodii]|uniref:uncharacterized protein n=1 Tax=Haliotis cracherodii TaxID=6455 RepID=UPI0039E756A1
MALGRLIVTASLLLVTVAYISGSQYYYRKHPEKDDDKNRKMTPCSATDGVTKFGLPTKAGDVSSGGRVSGLGVSRRHSGYIYAITDVGGENVVRVLNIKGVVVGDITISNAANVNWEDAAVGNCVFDTSKTCLYILDAGTVSPANIIYIVEEPDVITGTQAVNYDMMITFGGWNAGGFCTETLLVDPDANMYLFSIEPQGVDVELYKVVNNGGIWSTQIQTTITLPSTNTGPEGADLSPSGEELLVLFHDTVYHFLVENNNVKAALANAPNILPYVPDPSGTGIAWASDECGYHTSTEEDNPVLRFSDRNGADASQAARFNYGKVVGQIDYIASGSVTGIAFSKNNPDFIYAVTTGASASTAIIVIQASNGYHVSTFVLNSVTNTDWQDIAVGPKTSGGQNYIYILDGGAADGGPARAIITLPEPDDVFLSQAIDINPADIFLYDMTVGESHALTVTSSGRIFITNYQDTYDEAVTLYQLVEVGAPSRLPVPIGSFPHKSSQDGPEGLDVASDDSFLLVKNSDSVLFFPVTDHAFAMAITSCDAIRLPYVAEMNGYSVAIAPDKNSYYTLSNAQQNKLKRYDAIAECPKPLQRPRDIPRYRLPPQPRYPTGY